MFNTKRDIRNIRYDISQQDKLISDLERRISDLEYANKIAVHQGVYVPFISKLNNVDIKEAVLAILDYLKLDLVYIPEKLPTVKLSKLGDKK